jgi:plastocyanin
MDPSTASYYRAILYADSQDSRQLPPTLIRLHAWAVKRGMALGLGGTISKQSALAVAMTWLSSTKEGRAFADEFTTIGGLFSEAEIPLTPGDEVKWEKVQADSKVIVNVNDQTLIGKYIGRRSSWVDVMVDGERKSYRLHQVQVQATGV